MQEINGYEDNKRAKATDILVDFQFTDETRQTLDYITIHLKDLFDSYGYIPKTDAIPIEWLRMWFTKKASLIGITLMSEIESDWEKENESNI